MADRFAALIVVPIIVIEQSSPGEPWAVGNWVVWFLFLAEVVVMSGGRPRPSPVAAGASARDRHRRSDTAVSPGEPSGIAGLSTPRVLRLIAAVRYARRLFTLDGLRYGALIAVITVLAGGAAFAAAEGSEVTTWDGVWWAMTTITTVGYGDISPTTDTGRFIAIVVMLVGIGFLSILIGSVSERFLAAGLTEEVAEVEAEVEEDVTAVKHEILGELRAIGDRLRELEAQVEQSSKSLRRPRPADKSLGDSLTGSPPAEELGEGGRGQAIARDRGEEDKHRQALAEVDVRDLMREANMPASRRSLIFLRLSIREEQRELEGVRQRNKLEL